MDILKKATDFVLKYRYVALILLIGLIFMLLPGQTEQTQVPNETQPQENTDIAGELELILSQIDGVGKVKVMLTEQAGQEILYQFDENGERRDTVIIAGDDRAESGLVQQVIPAEYRGAVIVCQGADNAVVRLNVIEAVSKVTGLGTDRICVLKMK